MPIEVKQMQINAHILSLPTVQEERQSATLHRSELEKIKKEIMNECRFLFKEMLIKEKAR